MSSSNSDTYNQNPIPRARFTGIFIPSEILEINDLTPTDMILLSWIDSLFCKEYGGCFASNDYLAEKLHLKEKTISKNISKLIELGLVEKVSFNGRFRVIRACKEKWYQSDAASDLNRSLNPTKIGGRPLPESEPHIIYSKEEIKQQQQEEVVVVSEEETKQKNIENAQAMHLFLIDFSKKRFAGWKISQYDLLQLINRQGVRYVTDQLNYMCDVQLASEKDLELPYKKRKTCPIDNPAIYLIHACLNNYARSEWYAYLGKCP